MSPSAQRKQYSYDIFISHNRADKEWARTLADRLAAERLHGRALRPWLDEQFLDPGGLASETELTTAIDRSRLFGLVLSPEAVAAKWVDFELEYFLGGREREALVPMLRRTCSPPASLADSPSLDFREDPRFEESLNALISKLCPVADVGVAEVEREVDAAFAQFEANDPGGLDAEPTPERDAFFKHLISYDVDNLVLEGLAIAAFRRAIEHLHRIHAAGSPAVYNYKMLLGECLAAGLHRSAGFGQITQYLLEISEQQPGDAPFLFVVARAFSKLAEIDLTLVDMSVLLRITSQLDKRSSIGNEERTVEMLLGRVVGKMRDKPIGEMLIKTLSEGGRTSRIVAAAAIAFISPLETPVFYLSELESLYQKKGGSQSLPSSSPSKRLLGELFALDLHQEQSVVAAVRQAKEDLQRAFPDIDFPYGLFWFFRKGISVTNLHNAPFMGTIVKATVANMVKLAESLDAARVVCLTQPRIVDALLDRCGAMFILPQDPDSHLCRRLRQRGIPFGMLTQETMSELSDGDHVVVDQANVTVWNKTNEFKSR
jgi:hypothetical protein